MPSGGVGFLGNALRDREAFSMLLQPFDAEQLCANGFFQRRKRGGTATRFARI
jgi:hypothetical protein